MRANNWEIEDERNTTDMFIIPCDRINISRLCPAFQCLKIHRVEMLNVQAVEKALMTVTLSKCLGACTSLRMVGTWFCLARRLRRRRWDLEWHKQERYKDERVPNAITILFLQSVMKAIIMRVCVCAWNRTHPKHSSECTIPTRDLIIVHWCRQAARARNMLLKCFAKSHSITTLCGVRGAH